MDDLTYDSPPPYTAVPSSSTEFSSSLIHSYNTYQHTPPPLPSRASLQSRSVNNTSYAGKRERASTPNGVVDFAGNVVNIAGSAVGTAVNVAVGVTVAVTSASLGAADAGINATHTASTYAVNSVRGMGVFLEETRKPLSKNKGKLYIKQSNSPLELNESWSGRKCHLLNSNGNITVHGSLVSDGSIQLETTKGNITIDGHIVASKDIDVKSSYGIFSVHGSSIIANNLTIENSHSPLQLNNLIEVKKLFIKNKNAPIVMNRISLVTQLSIKATKTSVDICIRDIKSSSAKMEIETTNAPVNVYLSSKFSGEFDIKSKKGRVTVVVCSGAFGTLSFDNNEDSFKSGRFKSGKKSKNLIYIRTCNAPATIYIQ